MSVKDPGDGSTGSSEPWLTLSGLGRMYVQIKEALDYQLGGEMGCRWLCDMTRVAYFNPIFIFFLSHKTLWHYRGSMQRDRSFKKPWRTGLSL
ncbi:uncharacterized [Tachysurus ichikawai]